MAAEEEDDDNGPCSGTNKDNEDDENDENDKDDESGDQTDKESLRMRTMNLVAVVMRKRKRTIMVMPHHRLFTLAHTPGVLTSFMPM
jgi:hypothetical protein